MSYNTKLMHVQMPPPRQRTMPAVTTSSTFRTLGSSRGGGMSKSGDFIFPKTDDKRKENGGPSRPSLSLKDITKFDLMSPCAVQQLTGSFQSSFPTIAGKEANTVKMLNVQLPKNPYAGLPRLALTKGEDIRDEARTSLTRGFSRSHSELSHYRTRDSHRALLDRPHTESRLTRRAQHGGPAFFSSRACTISEESRQPLDSEENSNTEATRTNTETFRTDTETKFSRFEEPSQQSEKSKTGKESFRIQRTKLLSQTKPVATRREQKTGRAKTEEKMANLAMSAYTEVHANNRQIKGQVWGRPKSKTSPEGSRLVRFNTQNDVFEYTPGQCLF